MEQMIPLTIDGVHVEVPAGTTVLEAARIAKVNIPTLCYLKDINETANCRLCVVDCGGRALQAACVLPVAPNMVVKTNTPAVRQARRINLELILSNHEKKCLSCVRSQNCELQKLCLDLGVESGDRFAGSQNQYETDTSSVSIVRNNNKCILCRRCVGACSNLQGCGVIGANERGFKTYIGCAFDDVLDNVACVSCGQCIVVCPTGALAEKDNTKDVWRALGDPTKHVIVQTAPSIRVTLGEAFGMHIGTNVEGKMVAALRRLGFDGVYDTDFAADMTIVEEANELVERIKNGGKLPMITSCSPGWVNYCEHYFPDMIPNLSTCKSPQQMFGATVKTWYAQKMGWDPKDIFVVGIMPCTAKKFEVRRDNEDAAGSGIPDVDISLTTRELARMIDRAGIDFTALPDEDFDSAMGESTGAGVIFGATGGVMEAALRTAAEWVGGKPLQDVEFKEVRGTEGIKEASYQIGDLTVNVAVASSLACARKLLEQVRAGMKNYHFIEIMGCPGGCVNGGGQPVQPASVRNFVDLKSLRAKALYDADEAKPLRKSHENPELLKIYEEYFGEFGSHLAHRILHTTYVERPHF